MDDIKLPTNLYFSFYIVTKQVFIKQKEKKAFYFLYESEKDQSIKPYSNRADATQEINFVLCNQEILCDVNFRKFSNKFWNFTF